MTRTLLYTVSTITVVGVMAGGYYFLRESRTVSVETVVAPASEGIAGATLPKAAPDHGNFERRFQPKPPPSTGAQN